MALNLLQLSQNLKILPLKHLVRGNELSFSIFFRQQNHNALLTIARGMYDYRKNTFAPHQYGVSSYVPSV